MRILVTGGARSGKSRHAVALLKESTASADAPEAASTSDTADGSNTADTPVTFVAPGPPLDSDDEDWAHRVAHHQASRPTTWRTLETADLPAALSATTGPVLIDCLATWLTSTVDALDLWDANADEVRAAVDEHTAALCAALADHDDDVVLVTNEVGSGVVPAHRSGSLFRDLLGSVNQAVAEACDEVHLMVCGRVMRL